MVPVVRVTFPYSPAEHAEAVAQSTRERRRLQFIRYTGIIFAITGLLTGLLAVLGGATVRSAAGNALGFVGLGAFWFGVAPAILNVLYKRQFRREALEERRKLETVSLGPEGIIPGARWAHPVPWSEVKRVRETERLILIEASSDGPSYVPKHAMTAEDLTKLEGLLREQFRDRPKDLRLRS